MADLQTPQTNPLPNETKVLEAIDTGFDVLGQNVKFIFYKKLESATRITRSCILAQPDQFVTFLASFFRLGAGIVEGIIVREILRNFGFPISVTSSFKTALEMVRGRQ